MINVGVQKGRYLHQSQLAGGLWFAFKFVSTTGSTHAIRILRNYSIPFRKADSFGHKINIFEEFRVT